MTLSRFLNKTVCCPACGQMTEVSILCGAFYPLPPDLDGDTHNPSSLNTVQVCRHCGYAADSLQEMPPENISELLKSDAYQAVLNDPEIDSTNKNLRLAILADEFSGNTKSAARHCMMLVWHLRTIRADEAVVSLALNRAIECLSVYLEENADPETACVLIDCLRRAGDFEGAEETAQSLMPYVSDTQLAAVVKFERSLIAAHDSEAHSLSEVTA